MRRLAKYIIPPARLLELASESAGARAEVIERLLDVVEDPAAEDESPIADAWMAAVKVPA